MFITIIIQSMAIIFLVVTLIGLQRSKKRLSGSLKKNHEMLKQKSEKLLEIKERHQREFDKRLKTGDNIRSYLKLLDTLINTIPNPIFFKDNDGKYRGCNNAFAEYILGISRDKIIGYSIYDLYEQIPPDLAAIYQKHEEKLKRDTGAYTYEAWVHCSDGKRRQFLFSIALFNDPAAGTAGNIGVMIDLTEKNRAANERVQKEKLQGVLETVGAVCHEFNQPVQAIAGYIELLQLKNIQKKDIQPELKKIRNQIVNIGIITKKLMGITRYETKEYIKGVKIIDINKSSSLKI